MSILAILLFFAYTLGLGYTATRFLKSPDNFLERSLMRIGIGLASMPLLFLLLSLLHIPLDWKIILFLSLITPLVCLIKDYKNITNIKIKATIKKSDIYIFLVLILFFATLFMYVKGSFVYPYLEDDDSWGHATGVKYVATEKTVFNPEGGTNYLDPYPPAYDSILGLLHQASPSISWTIKFFNALMISLGIIFFYFFAKEFTSDRGKALFATFALTVIPSYLSHFIWSHALIPGFFVLAFYSLERIKYDKGWIIPSALAISAIFLTHLTQSIKFGVFFLIYWIVKTSYSKKLWREQLAPFVLAFLVSLLWWAARWRENVGIIHSYTMGTASAKLPEFTVSAIWNLIKKTLPAGSGTATRAYTFDDFFFAKFQNLINNPIGIGIMISILLLLGTAYLFFKYKTTLKSDWKIIALLWLIFTFIGINTVTFKLPIGLFAFRFWMLFAIPASIIAAEGMWLLFDLARLTRVPRHLILAIVILGMVFTAGAQKYTVNTAQWPPGAFWTSPEEINGFLWMKQNLPPNTKVFSFVNEGAVIGSDMNACRWCKEEREFKKAVLNITAVEMYDWLKARDYEYLVIEGQFAKRHGLNSTNAKLNEIAGSGLFIPSYQTNGFFLFKLTS